MSRIKNPHINEIIAASLSRRGFLKASAVVGAAFAVAPASAFAGTIAFKNVAENVNNQPTVPEGYEWHKLVSWGDALYIGQEDAKTQYGAPFIFTRKEQEQRVGTCNDMFALFAANYSYPWKNSTLKDYIFCSNNEYIVPYILVPPKGDEGFKPTPEEVEAMYAAMGVTIAKVSHNPQNGEWKLQKTDKSNEAINRRITPFTEVIFDAHAANHDWLQTAAQKVNQSEAQKGNKPKNANGVLCGTMQNCAGGYTPWGTYLTAEENLDNSFFTSDKDAAALKNAQTATEYQKDQKSFYYKNSWKFGGPNQFDLSQNPYGPSLYGWVVEIDPYDPSWTPRKRTMIGRKKNECATCVLTPDGHAVIYNGDDQNNEHVYKFISKGKFNPKDRKSNRNLLEDGTLYAAKFNADGTGEWLEISLEAANNAARDEGETEFKDLADLKVRTREAAYRLGATPMDRPEDVEAPKDEYFKGKGQVYIVCTGNLSEKGREGNAANPRRQFKNQAEINYTGQIVRINEDKNNHGSLTFGWEIFVMGGDHSAADVEIERTDKTLANMSSWKDGKPTTLGDRFAMPDNITFDNYGNAWFTTDGTPDNFKCNDGIYVVDTNAPAPRTVKRFLTGPVGCELTGPLMSPDNKTFFCGFQHIGSHDVDGKDYKGKTTTPPSTFPNDLWPRDTIIYVRRKDGGIVGK